MNSTTSLTGTITPPSSSNMAQTGSSRQEDNASNTSNVPTITQTGNGASGATAHRNEQHPTIRFIPHMEMRSSRPSLHFTAITKTLKNGQGIIKVGRYTEREQTVSNDESQPVGFKSKVVSRRHCEFWCTAGQWYVKDVKSSSGTFLNHVRLSSPGLESRPYPVNDGDVVQLGIDFKGGEEIIFRCVKIRIECNRGWQKALNSYNTNTHKSLLNSVAGKNKRTSTASSTNHECSICLNPVTPCQCLFVAPCSHVWHYKCVRNLVHGPQWPNFLCPNCRYVADLEADVDAPEEDIYEDFDSVPENEAEANGAEVEQNTQTNGEVVVGASSANEESDEPIHPATPEQTTASIVVQSADNDEQADRTSDSDSAAEARLEARLAAETEPMSSSSTRSLPIANSMAGKRANSPSFIPIGSRTPENTTRFAIAAGALSDQFLTPRNDAGPFVLDGAAGRTGSPAR